MSRLETLSPLKTLARGYSVTRLADSGKVVTTTSSVRAGSTIETTVTDGKFRSTVSEILPESR